ncbi:arginine repressor [Porphyromonadaceae bacterium OttesenSCG-928-L07]|nr:arginine repressor [Porphyromonadaceae bacterium OttesenSCG-928-L07]
MRNKTKRLQSIRNLIESELISSQEELLFRLKELGIEATQSTLSRDLKFMKVAKIPNKEKGYVYIIPGNINEQKEDKISSIITDAMLSLDFSGNMAVIKTLPGYANAVTALIDSENYFEILGTIAGDDTIFIVMREGVNRSGLIEALSSIYPDIHSLYILS